MSNRDIVINFMSSIKGRTPILLLSKAARIFKSIYDGRIYDVKNIDDMNLIRDMSISRLHKAVVLEDLSSLYTDEDILKLIEESSLQFILLAYRDSLSEVLMSRCKSILKIPDIDIFNCNYTNKLTAYNNITQSNLYGDTMNMYLAENCPSLMRDIIDTQFLKYKERVVSILANMEGDD